MKKIETVGVIIVLVIVVLGGVYGLRVSTCPDALVQPWHGVVGDTSPSQYYIKGGLREEFTEHNETWVKYFCRPEMLRPV